MRLATARTTVGTQAFRIDGATAFPLADPDVGSLLSRADWREHAAGATADPVPVEQLDLAPLLTRPTKILCVGLNYRSHIEESHTQVPEFPTLFAKFANALTGAYDTLPLPAESDRVDWEAELGVVVGSTLRRGSHPEAQAAIAGYTIVNDISIRDWQMRTTQWLQGKTFEAMTPVGPWLVTADEFDPIGQRITCAVNGITVQDGDLGDLLFDPAAIVAYISTITTLEPGDLILTGTPGGVGQSMDPPQFLRDGDRVTTSISGIGRLNNLCRQS